MSARACVSRALPAWGRNLARALCAHFLMALFLATPGWCGWQKFSLADGLVTSQLATVAQDSSENIWFGSEFGVSRYDGVTFRTFTDVDGLIGLNVQTIFTDHLGRIWFGTFNGVSMLSSAGWTSYTVNDGLADGRVRGIFEDSAGHMWFATFDGASRFDGTTWTTFRQSDGLASNQLTCVFQDRAGDMWFGTETAGVSRWNGSTWTTYNNSTTSNGLADNSIRCILETRDGIMWVGTKLGGVSRFNGASWTTIATAGNIGFVEVSALREDRYGALWVACIDGLARFDGLAWRSFTTADGLSAKAVSSIEIDNIGNLWAATLEGASRYDGESWKSYPKAGGAQAVLEDTSGVIWVATADSGAARYDRSAWTNVTVATTGGGLASDNVRALLQDSTGAMWFGTDAGVSRLNGAVWQTFTTVDGLAGNNIARLARDSSGGVWIGTTTGLSHYDGANWTSYTMVNGLPGNRVRSLLVARDGSLWCGTSAGVARLQNATWTTYTTTDGLAHNWVHSILQDHTGAMWFGTQEGLSRFDGQAWRTWRIADGLAADVVFSLAETSDAVLWVGTQGGGVSRFDGELWHTYDPSDGLINSNVSAALVEHSGNLWFGTDAGASLHEFARVPAKAVITTPPPPLSPNRLQTVPFVAAYRQTLGIEFSTSFDSGPWSPWSPEAVWVGRDLVDGVHTLRVAARDILHHDDPTPASATFEIAATAPIPQITVPTFREPGRDTLQIRGVATAQRFRSLKLEMRPAAVPHWNPPETIVLAQSTTPVADGVIARLATRDFPDGDYELRLSVQDTLGLIGYDQVTFIIDNVEPFAAQTTPAQVSALSGGDVFTTNRETHVYIPPRGLPQDAIVSLTPLAESAVPATLPDGATLLDPGVAIAMNDLQNSQTVPLEKTAILDREVSIATISFPAGTRLAFYFAGSDNVWKRIGGTLDEATNRFATTFTSAGNFAIYAAPADATLASPLQLSLTPRVLSSRGQSATPGIKIAFVMARAGSARVTVHNKAGRLLRVVMDGQPLAPGTNLVNWDGHDTDARDVPPGMYFVTVEALGERSSQAVGVVR